MAFMIPIDSARLTGPPELAGEHAITSTRTEEQDPNAQGLGNISTPHSRHSHDSLHRPFEKEPEI